MDNNKNLEGNFIFSDQNNENDSNNIYTNTNDTFDFNKYKSEFENREIVNRDQVFVEKKVDKKKTLIYLMVLIIIALCGYILYQNLNLNNKNSSTNNSTTQNGLQTSPTPDTDSTPSSSGILTGTQVAEKIMPSAVAIVTYSTTQSSFGKILPSGYGSGVIMSADGYIITNAHVISSAKSIGVILSDKTEYKAEVIGTDTKTDLAVLKIDAKNLTPAEFGDSSKLKEGEDVYAIGNPTGVQLSGSFTKGIISGLNRRIESYGGATLNAIQTDAAINPGNSGGALVNSYGQVIGINSSKISSVSYEGIGFSIPINEAKPIIDSILQYGYVKDRVRLGVSLTTIDEISAALNSMKPGLYISSIEEKTNIYKAGARQGDCIINFDGKAINNSTELLNELLLKKPGEEVTMTLYRANNNGIDGQNIEISFVLEEDTNSNQQ